jgi:signal transduction histidine kinase
MDFAVDSQPSSGLATRQRAHPGARWVPAIAALSAIAAAAGLVDPVHVVNPGARAALETTITLSAILSVGLLVALYGQTRRVPDLLLLCALLAVLLGDFVYRSAPALAKGAGLESHRSTLIVWELIASLMLLATALAPRKKLQNVDRGVVAVVVAACLGTVMLGELLEQFIFSARGSGQFRSSEMGVVAGHPVALGLEIITAFVLALAALAFLRRRSGRLEDRLLGGAAFLLTGASLQYLAMPAVATDWVTPRDGLRLGAYLLVLGTAFTRYDRARRRKAVEAISSERQRIARDLHDGLAQDLACIAAQSQRLDLKLGPDHPLIVAARHALAASRGAITDLCASTASSTEGALRLVASELEHRYGLQVRVRIESGAGLDGSRDVEPSYREDLVRIAREAIVNAAVHGRARHVEVVLRRQENDLLLRVSDDGRGISDRRQLGFGLRTMEARAASLGGRLSAHQRDEGGTELELQVP